MNVSRVIIFTNDVKKLSDFYISCFELSVVGESDASWTELNAGGCNIAFHKTSEQGTGRDGWTKIVFGSDDVSAEKTRLEGLGIKMSGVNTFGDIRMCDGRDPDGNYFQISSRGI